MYFRQYNLSCLSLFSYMIGDTTTGNAVVIDPQRDVSGYLADAAANGLAIVRVIETHVHADFLSGHRELAAATGAVVSYGSRAMLGFAFEPLAHGQRLSLGDVTLEVRHTPGHTPEGISIVVHSTASSSPVAVFAGDTLFIGDVGRPDLLAAAGVTAHDLAADLYRSLHEQLLTLPDDVAVYPAHGAGSACGKHMSMATSSTIGEQRTTNYAVQPMTVEAFTEIVTAGQSAVPPYFAHASPPTAMVITNCSTSIPPVPALTSTPSLMRSALEWRSLMCATRRGSPRRISSVRSTSDWMAVSPNTPGP